jgi:sodium/potassium/calcium exchanger 6
MLLVAMYNLGSTADLYLSPALEAISDKFSCSESLAGVTLLALGNGAPDVFAAMAAGGDSASNGDSLLSVSALFGSALFVSCIVLVLSANASSDNKQIRVTKRFFIRDLIFYYIASLYVLYIMIFKGEIDYLLAAGFFVIYLTFVGIVVL